MNKKRLTLSALKVSSFQTSVEVNQVKGGNTPLCESIWECPPSYWDNCEAQASVRTQ